MSICVLRVVVGDGILVFGLLVPVVGVDVFVPKQKQHNHVFG
jgi:hypothetical protein